MVWFRHFWTSLLPVQLVLFYFAFFFLSGKLFFSVVIPNQLLPLFLLFCHRHHHHHHHYQQHQRHHHHHHNRWSAIWLLILSSVFLWLNWLLLNVISKPILYFHLIAYFLTCIHICHFHQHHHCPTFLAYTQGIGNPRSCLFPAMEKINLIMEKHCHNRFSKLGDHNHCCNHPKNIHQNLELPLSSGKIGRRHLMP